MIEDSNNKTAEQTVREAWKTRNGAWREAYAAAEQAKETAAREKAEKRIGRLAYTIQRLVLRSDESGRGDLKRTSYKYKGTEKNVHHAILSEPFRSGRFSRREGDLLCRTGQPYLWLSATYTATGYGEGIDCPKRLALIARHGKAYELPAQQVIASGI